MCNFKVHLKIMGTQRPFSTFLSIAFKGSGKVKVSTIKKGSRKDLTLP